MELDHTSVARIRGAIQPQRLLELAMKLVGIPSPTRSAGAVADALADHLRGLDFPVERPDAGWTDAPAVVARLQTGNPGRTLQFNGHLDTVHLPFVPPRVENGFLYGSGASDMKGGIAAMAEAMCALRDGGLFSQGSILFTTHDLHESPWGDGSQVDRLIDEGFVGDGVLLPEYLASHLPLVGRGLAVLEVTYQRDGDPVHEVMGGIEQPNVIRAGAELIRRFGELDEHLSQWTHPVAGRESVFVGRIQAGEIYNQSPVELQISGTRRWLPGTDSNRVRDEFESLVHDTARDFGVRAAPQFHFTRDAYEVAEADPLVTAFQASYAAIRGTPLPTGAKPFVDDGNTFVARGRIPSITHGPDAKGAHTLHEEVAVDELVRVAEVYALTALAYCQQG